MKHLVIAFFFLVSIVSTSWIFKDNKLTQQPRFEKIIPKNWPLPAKNIFEKNKLSADGFFLGKKLFYEKSLSKNNTINCASCHQQEFAFSNAGKDLSEGVNDSLTKRNAPALINIAWMNQLHWDGAINHIEVQPLAPITAKNEMNEQMKSIIQKLSIDKNYPVLFKKAFGDTIINSKRILKALAQFVGSLVSSNSKYDKAMIGKAFFSKPELQGYQLFKSNCASCHPEPLFTDNDFHNNGMTLNSLHDIGLQGITHQSKDSLKFKVPTLRNIVVTYPYMHDGSIKNLNSIIDHYENNNLSNPILDKRLQRKISFTEQEKKALIEFLHTLTDNDFLHNRSFAKE